MATPRIFDPALRPLRAARARGREDFVRARVRAELVERLMLVSRELSRVVEIEPADDALSADLGRPVAPARFDADERLELAEGAADLIVSTGGLDRLNDLPGALVQIRRALRPDGLFLAGLAGAGTLAVLRASLIEAELATGRAAAPRLHPQIDVRAAGDLLQRAGFALPVADGEILAVRYAGLDGLVRDIRASGAANALLARDRRPLDRAMLAAAHAAFAARAGADGRTPESLALVYLSGWAPSPDQPRQARRGSGTVSLADALKSRA